jgi:hypothetical protein
MEVYSTGKAFDHVKIMLESMYGSKPEYQNVVFILGYNVIEGGIRTIKSMFPSQKIITLQLEMLYNGSMWVTPENIETLKYSDQVWDYDENNIKFLFEEFGIKCKFFSMQFVPELNTIPILPREKHDIDILFYGSMKNSRRLPILDSIKQQLPHLNIVTRDDLWDEELEDNIQRAKIILNLHHFNGGMQEQVRLFYLMSNHKCIVSEPSRTNYYKGAILEITPEKIAAVCNGLIQSGKWFDYAKESLRSLIMSNHYYSNRNGNG